MLVLSRKFGEEIVIGEPGPDQIVVALKKLGKNRVQISVKCRREIAVLRGEMLDLQNGGDDSKFDA